MRFEIGDDAIDHRELCFGFFRRMDATPSLVPLVAHRHEFAAAVGFYFGPYLKNLVEGRTWNAEPSKIVLRGDEMAHLVQLPNSERVEHDPLAACVPHELHCFLTFFQRSDTGPKIFAVVLRCSASARMCLCDIAATAASGTGKSP